MNPLLTFYNDKHMKEAVEALFVDTLKELAVTKAFKGESNVGIAEAKVVLDYSFAKLENMFAPKKKIVRRVIK